MAFISDPDIDPFIAGFCNMDLPLSYIKLKKIAESNGLQLRPYMQITGIKYAVDHNDPFSNHLYTTKTAAYREGIVRWIVKIRKSSSN